jgi:hypothetical protein
VRSRKDLHLMLVYAGEAWLWVELIAFSMSDSCILFSFAVYTITTGA